MHTLAADPLLISAKEGSLDELFERIEERLAAQDPEEVEAEELDPEELDPEQPDGLGSSELEDALDR